GGELKSWAADRSSAVPHAESRYSNHPPRRAERSQPVPSSGCRPPPRIARARAITAPRPRPPSQYRNCVEKFSVRSPYLPSLKFRRGERESRVSRKLRSVHGHARNLPLCQRHAEIHPRQQRRRVHPVRTAVGVSRGLELPVKRLAHLA